MCSKVLNGHIILTDTSITTILAPEMTYTPVFMQMSLTVEERLDRIEQLLRGQKNVLNFSDACDFTGISPSYMYKLTHNARIPHYKPHGKNVYFLREELEQWLLQNPVRTAEQKDREATEFVLRKRRPR